jgi:hypothetical protein
LAVFLSPVFFVIELCPSVIVSISLECSSCNIRDFTLSCVCHALCWLCSSCIFTMHHYTHCFYVVYLTLSNPMFLPPACCPALIYFGWEGGWWVTCNYPTVLKEKNRNRKSATCAVCWLKSVVHEEKCREQENHNVG